MTTIDLQVARSRGRLVPVVLLEFWLAAIAAVGVVGLVLSLLDGSLSLSIGIPLTLGCVAGTVAAGSGIGPALRALLTRPRVWLEDDVLVIHDPVLFRQDERVPRASVRSVKILAKNEHQNMRVGHAAELTPFRETLNLEISLRHGVPPFSTARGSRAGNWVWHFGRPWHTRPVFPERAVAYKRLRLRVEDPARVEGVLVDWLAAAPNAK